MTRFGRLEVGKVAGRFTWRRRRDERKAGGAFCEADDNTNLGVGVRVKHLLPRAVRVRVLLAEKRSLR